MEDQIETINLFTGINGFIYMEIVRESGRCKRRYIPFERANKLQKVLVDLGWSYDVTYIRAGTCVSYVPYEKD